MSGDRIGNTLNPEYAIFDVSTVTVLIAVGDMKRYEKYSCLKRAYSGGGKCTARPSSPLLVIYKPKAAPDLDPGYSFLARFTGTAARFSLVSLVSLARARLGVRQAGKDTPCVGGVCSLTQTR